MKLYRLQYKSRLSTNAKSDTIEQEWFFLSLKSAIKKRRAMVEAYEIRRGELEAFIPIEQIEVEND